MHATLNLWVLLSQKIILIRSQNLNILSWWAELTMNFLSFHLHPHRIVFIFQSQLQATHFIKANKPYLKFVSGSRFRRAHENTVHHFKFLWRFGSFSLKNNYTKWEIFLNKFRNYIKNIISLVGNKNTVL